MVQPAGDGPTKIRRRPSAAPGWLRPALLGAVAVVSVALIAGGAYSILHTPTSNVPTATPSSAGPTSSLSPTPAGTASTSVPTRPSRTTPGTPTTGPTSPPPPTVVTQSAAVPIYYAAPQPGGSLRLFREFHRISYTSGRGAAAVAEMLQGAPADKDYRSLWPSSALLRRYARAGDTVTLDFSAAPTDKLAVQQLVYTVTAVESANHVARVRLTVGGVSRGIYTRTSHVFVEGAVWVTAPFDGAVVSSPVTFEGVATVFEATVPWDLLRGTTVVHKGFAQATVGAPSRGTWKVTLRLSPGTYVFRAMSRSEADGRVGAIDTKSLTVR